MIVWLAVIPMYNESVKLHEDGFVAQFGSFTIVFPSSVYIEEDRLHVRAYNQPAVTALVNVNNFFSNLT